MYDGTQWISDFKQNHQFYGSEIAQKEDPDYTIYRHPSWQ